MAPRQQQGFTLVELVTVLILIGIVSALGIGLFARTSSFTALAGRDLLVSTALLAQSRALGNPDPGNPVTLSISQTADEWRFAVSQGGVAFDTRTQSRESGSSLNINGSAPPVTLSYGTDGSLASGTNQAIVFSSGGNSKRLCIASTGFPYTGACQP